VRTLKIQEVPVFDKSHKVIAVEGIAEDITERKRAEKKLETYQTQLKRLSSALSLTEERERRRISEDLHDRIGQALTVIKMKLEELKNPQVETDSDSVLNETGDLLDNAIQDTRTLTFEISPPLLYELGFESAVEWLIEQFRERHNIPIEYDGNDDGSKLDDDVSFFLFKSVRELLFNVIKHACANRIKVSVRREKHNIRISIQDDGIGFDFSKVQFSVNNLSGFGLFSMRERMEHFGGNFEVVSKPGKGARITLIMPLKPEEEDWVKWIKR
jgi:signal transduction histidine kinase